MFGFFGRIGRTINDTLTGGPHMETRTETVEIQDPDTGETQRVQAKVQRRKEPDFADEMMGVAATFGGGMILLGMMGDDAPAEGASTGGGAADGMGMGDLGGLGDCGDL